MSKHTAPRTKGDCQQHEGEYGLRGTKPVGRTTLLAEGGKRQESTAEPAVSREQDTTTKPEPATRQLREKQKNPTGLPSIDYPNGCEWERDAEGRYRHLGCCGGEIVGVDKARPFCRTCEVEWYLLPRERVWKRFGGSER